MQTDLIGDYGLFRRSAACGYGSGNSRAVKKYRSQCDDPTDRMGSVVRRGLCRKKVSGNSSRGGWRLDLSARAMLERFTSEDSGNFINFKDEEYDETFAKAIATTDEKEQLALYHRLEEILAERAANVYIQDLANLVAVSD